ncbi:MAG: methylated-DNA-protein-cysteine methyltransferase-like protein [Candidatus Azotimanducaceae bacterium]|jgi:methylated-DNA-protein-cysteine methyltransferase-like protein
MAAGQFSQRVWELALSIPEGRVTTYGIIARAAGGGGQAARSITGILSKAPNKAAIPFHRIVYSGGKVWMTPECEDRRREIYELEGITVNQKGFVQDFEEVVYYFD